MIEGEINLDDVNEREPVSEPPKRGRGRPRKTESVEASFDGTEQPKPKRTRRSTKLTGDHVSQLISYSSTMMVMYTGHTHWMIDPSECKTFAPQMAELFNQIPTRYVKAFIDLNSYVVVAFGLYQTFVPRIKMERELRTHKRTETHRGAIVGQEQMQEWGDIPTTTQDER